MLAAGAGDPVFQSPDRSYEPQLAGRDPWRWAQALVAAGFGAHDLVLNCFGYHLSPAGAMFDAGCTALGRVSRRGHRQPGSPGASGRGSRHHGIHRLPSYLRALIERYDAAVLPRDGGG